MKTRILFVDDDPMLLSSMERCLGAKFDLTTALSGPEALQAIDEQPAFKVIITDMRMPVMDGVQFIERARQCAPHAKYLMLTGNQDIETAIRAVNEGRVTKFLNKPCDPSDITAAVETAAQVYDLEASERELLNKTFIGSVGIFADVMETLQPELLGRAGRTEQFAEQLREHCGVHSRWEFKIASKLSMVGQALHGNTMSDAPTSPQALADLAEACSTTARMIDRIPRMSLIAQIIRAVPTTDGEIEVLDARGDGDVVRLGAAILRVAQIVEGLSHLGLDIDQAETEIRSALPNAYEPLLEAVRKVYPANSESDAVAVQLTDLKPGMILSENLARPDGATLLREGRRLSETHIEKLLSETNLDEEIPLVMITRTSFETSAEEPLATV